MMVIEAREYRFIIHTAHHNKKTRTGRSNTNTIVTETSLGLNKSSNESASGNGAKVGQTWL